MKVVSESEFWAFVAQEIRQAQIEKANAKKPITLEEWLEQKIEEVLETKARFEREAAILRVKKSKEELHRVEKDIEYWNGYLDALEGVKKMLREVF